MSFVHSKNTVVTLFGVDLSPYVTSSEFNRGADSHDVTTYGKNDHVFQGGLGKGTASLEGIYDNTAPTGGPRATIEPMIGLTGTLIRKPEGTGSGKPQDSVTVLVEEYVETSPVADMVKWSVKLTLSDAVTSTTQ